MEIIKYNEIKKPKKHLISFSLYKMLDEYRPFDGYFKNFKILLPYLLKNNELFDIRVYFDFSCQKEIEQFIKEYTEIEFYNFNYSKLRINQYHHGVFGNIVSLLPIFENSYEYIYITDVIFKIEWIHWSNINFIIKNKIDTFYYCLPYGNEKYEISLPLLTKIKIDISIFNKFIDDIANNKYDNIINNLLNNKENYIPYNYKIKLPYGMDIYFINNIIYDKLCNGSVYTEITYDLLRLINKMYKFNYNKIYNMDQRSQDILEELKKLSDIKYNVDDLNIKGMLISLIVRFIERFSRDNFIKLFDEKHQKVILLLYKYIDNNKDKINSNSLYSMSELIKLK